MRTLSCIRRNLAHAVVTSCSEAGCTLELNGLSDWVALKGERIYTDRRMCDRIVFAAHNGLSIGIIELKSKTVHADEVVDKLTNGTEAALEISAQWANKQVSLRIYHLVLAQSWHPSQYKVITTRKITVGGKKYGILPQRCGVSFSQVISRFD